MQIETSIIYQKGDVMEEKKEMLAYEAPTMEKHEPIKAVQGSGGDYYCYGWYSYYYHTYYYYC